MRQSTRRSRGRRSSRKVGELRVGFNIVYFLMRLLDFYQILIIIWCIISWLPIPRSGVIGDLVGAVDALVRPYVDLFRRFIPPFGGLDFSPMLAILVLGVIQRAILVYF